MTTDNEGKTPSLRQDSGGSEQTHAINHIIAFSLRQRPLMLLAGLALLGYGLFSTMRLNVAAFPDVTNVQVAVTAAAPGMAAEQVESHVTYPIEDAMSGLPGATEVRSLSKTGLSQVTIVFKDEVDIYFARQLVQQRLLEVASRLPTGVDQPEMGPISTALGQIFMYRVNGEGKSLMELREINDWLVKRQIQNIEGVADVLSFGGEVRQYQVRVDPSKLVKYGIALNDVDAAIRANNTNAGGWYIEGEHEQLVVRGEGLLQSGDEGLRQLGEISIKGSGGQIVRVRNVAEIAYGAEIRQGAVSMDGKGEIVMSIILQLRDANTQKVIERVRGKLAEIEKALPDGVHIEPVYDQGMLVGKAVSTVSDALVQAAVLIIIVLFLFLWNVRSALVVLCSIPLSMMVAFVMMRWLGLSANLQSLGGLAIGIGMMVDGSIVVVENTLRHLSLNSDGKLSVTECVERASKEVGRSIFFSVLIIVVVFLPLFTLQGVEGKMFSPLAFSITFAMIGALLVSLTLAPVMASFLFKNGMTQKESFLVRYCRRAYEPTVKWAIGNRIKVVFCSGALLAVSIGLLPFLGTEFVPILNEGTMGVRVSMNPSISLAEAKRIAQQLERKLLTYSEVESAVSQIGRAELGGEPESIANNEIIVNLKPESEWDSGRSRDDLIEAISEELGEYPGVLLNVSQPIAMRVDELLSGVKAQIAVKLFGDDLEVLRVRGQQIQAAIASVPGASDVQMEQIGGEGQLVIAPKREALALYGLTQQDVMDVVGIGIGGGAISEIIEGRRRFDIYLRLDERFRDSPQSIGELLVANAAGQRIPLATVAEISYQENPPLISHENGQRRVVVQCNVRGRDLGSFVAEAQKAVEGKVTLPTGYFVTWGGQFENQQRAQATLLIVVPVALGLIFVFLVLSFNSTLNALLIILNVPFALIGGIIALALTGQYLSVPSSIGFIALFGVAVQNGIVLVSTINERVAAGASPNEAAVSGAIQRLRPVLMTAATTGLGLMPILLATGIGSEVQRPLATVVLGGLFTSTLLTLAVLPSVYKWFCPKSPSPRSIP